MLSARLWLQAFTAGCLVALVVGMTYVLVAVYESNHAAEEARTLLVECVIPPEEREPPAEPQRNDCWTRSQTSTSDLVGEPVGPINTVAVIAAACGAEYPGNIPATTRCVEDELARAQEAP
jgi:hypothetical protein